MSNNNKKEHLHECSPSLSNSPSLQNSGHNQTATTAAAVAATVPSKDAPSEKEKEELDFIIANTYRLYKKITSGSFGSIHLGENIETKTKVAVKLETIKNNKFPQLQIEHQIYQMLISESGFPHIYYYGQHNNYNVLVMQLLGKNLEQVFDLCKRQFSLKTILYIAIQLITRFECIHRNGIVYRDVKPENFMLGLDNDSNNLYILDFGLSKMYVDQNLRHIPMRINNHITGTARYMSLNAHRGCEHSRRDDLESLGYVLLYFLRQGKLPWIGFRGISVKERYKKIFEFKYSLSIETLCHGFPVEFANYLRYIRSIDFEQEPCYQYIQGLFVELFQREAFTDDGNYDWSNKLN